MPNKANYVRSFCLQPHSIQDYYSYDSETKRWLRPLLAAGSYAYLPEFARFIEHLQKNSASLPQILQNNQYFIETLFRAYARIRSNNGYMSMNLETIICGLYDGGREKILAALKNLQYEVNNQFARDLQIGFEVENFRGHVKRIIFDDVYNNFKRLELFIEFMNKSCRVNPQQINFIICMFHKNGYPRYHTILLSELEKNIKGNASLATKTQRLRIMVDKNNQFVSARVCKHYMIKDKTIGILSICCTLPETATCKFNLPEITRLPGIYKHENACVSISYQALEPEGCIFIPHNLPVKHLSPANLFPRLINHIVTSWKETLANISRFVLCTGLAAIIVKSLGFDTRATVAISCCAAGWVVANLWRKNHRKKLPKADIYPIIADEAGNIEVVGITNKESPQHCKEKTILPSPNIMMAVSNLEKAASTIQEKRSANSNNVIRLPII